MASPDVFKILKDLELRAVGLDPGSNTMTEGYFTSFRSVGLPIDPADFENPWSPLGANTAGDLKAANAAAADPSTAPKTGAGAISPSQALSDQIGHDMQAFLNGFLLTDDKLRMNSLYQVMPSAGQVSDAWWAIITGANGIPANEILNAQMTAAYAAATAVLMTADSEPTPHYEAYRQYEEKWEDKVKAWHRAYSDAAGNPSKLQTWPTDGVLYQQDADEAMADWESFGHKSEIDTARDTLAAQGIDPAMAIISRAKNQLQNSLTLMEGVGTFPYTIMEPNSWYDPDADDGWTDYTSDDAHSESHYTSSSTAISGNIGVNLGFFSMGGGFDSESTHTDLHITSNDTDVSFSYCVVDIKRPWLDASLLDLSNWFLFGDYKKGAISTGHVSEELPQPDGMTTFLPSIVTSLVLIKNLKITWDTSDTDWSSATSHVGSSGSIGWGPFAVSGGYDHRGQQKDFTHQADGQGLEVDGIQLLGYVSMVNPLSPQKDSADYMTKTTSPTAAGTTTPAGTATATVPAARTVNLAGTAVPTSR